MSYFSKITGQAGQPLGPRGRFAASGPQGGAPEERDFNKFSREEVVMVPGTGETEKSAAARAESTRPNEGLKPQSASMPAVARKAAQAANTANAANAGDESVEKRVSRRPVKAAPQPPVIQKERQTGPPKKDKIEEYILNVETLVQSEKQEAAGKKEQIALPDDAREIDELAMPEIPAGLVSSKVADAPEPGGQRFFTRTAEILEHGGQDPGETQNILLTELQEWAAAMPESAEGTQEFAEAYENKTLLSEAPETVANKNIARPKREPGVITINDERAGESDRMEDARAETRGIEEQTFELSIGTINVVVEDDRPLPQPAPVQNDNRRGSRGGAERRYSRLSRNYL